MNFAFFIYDLIQAVVPAYWIKFGSICSSIYGYQSIGYQTMVIKVLVIKPWLPKYLLSSHGYQSIGYKAMVIKVLVIKPWLPKYWLPSHGYQSLTNEVIWCSNIVVPHCNFQSFAGQFIMCYVVSKRLWWKEQPWDKNRNIKRSVYCRYG